MLEELKQQIIQSDWGSKFKEKGLMLRHIPKRRINVDKEKLMAYLSDAIDRGAWLEIKFIGDMDQREAENKALELSEIVGETVEVTNYNGMSWYSVGKLKKHSGSFFHKNSHMMIEDVDLSGSDDIGTPNDQAS